MPGRKYYCDYCDKQFYDTPASRKRHLQGISHQRAKKHWFDSFRDQESGQTQDVKRPPCTFFLRTGTCQYGNECRFEHPMPPAPAPLDSPAAVAGQYFPANEAINGGGAANPLSVAPGTVKVPESALANFVMRDLPPSLRPPPEGGYPPVAPLDWG